MKAVKYTMRGLAKTILHSMPLKRQLFHVFRYFYMLPESVYQHLYFKGPMSVPVCYGRTFTLYHWGNQVENDIFWAGLGNNWEATSVRLWLYLARSADTVLDIGANTGVFALSAKTVNPDATVYAFEPIERVHTRLQHNIDLNDFSICAVCVGVSNENGTATIFDVSAEHVYSASLNREMLSDRSDIIERAIEVVRIDTFFAERDAGGRMLVKIDTERHELQVLEGFGDLIRTLRPTFIVEILDRIIGQKVERFFEGLNYIWLEILEGEGLRPATHLGEAERNYLLCPREVAEALSVRGMTHIDLDPRRAGPGGTIRDKVQ